ncbi:hypothetical protein MEO41_29045, partial [Dolichospermum sp. ST_sed4]|nr:hypothetical protein [Dolichospermum sp. ST_sed4]
DWIKIFAQILQDLGFPGEGNLTDDEAKALEHFIESLQKFATTSLVVEKTTYKQALQILHSVIEHTIFQVASQIDSPINILGILEAAGLNFDYL